MMRLNVSRTTLIRHIWFYSLHSYNNWGTKKGTHVTVRSTQWHICLSILFFSIEREKFHTPQTLPSISITGSDIAPRYPRPPSLRFHRTPMNFWGRLTINKFKFTNEILSFSFVPSVVFCLIYSSPLFFTISKSTILKTYLIGLAWITSYQSTIMFTCKW